MPEKEYCDKDKEKISRGKPTDGCSCELTDLPARKYRSKDWLKHQYRHLEKSMREIAKEFGYGSTTINTWVEKHNIKKKEFGETVSKSKTKDKKYYKKSWLQQQYHEKGLTIPEIATEAGVSESAIKRAFQENEIETRGAWEYHIKQGPWDNKEWLIEHYVKKEKSVPDISKEFEVGQEIIYSRLEKYDIKRRNTGVKGEGWHQDKKYTNKDWLTSKYIDEEFSAAEMAEMCDTTRDTIYYWMDKYDIERRDPMERIKELAPNWKGGYASDYGSNWKRMRNKARKRDNNTCQYCGYEREDGEKHLDVHHIIPLKKFDKPEKANTLNNLITLCRSCHNKWEGIPLRPHNTNH
jgi:transposase